MKDKIKETLLCILLYGIPIGIIIVIIAAKIYWWNTPVSECPMWVLWLLK